MITAATAPDVARLRWQWARETDPTLEPVVSPDFVKAVADWMADPIRSVWTTRIDAPGGPDVVGMVALTEYTRMPSPQSGGRWGYLGHLYVAPHARGSSRGEGLVRHVVSTARVRGYRKVVLSPTIPSIPLYRRAGFAPAGGELMMLHLD
ncbi:GNAT family N-acetyltransferase [Williamsia sp. MIQD14]|uniref:GNAT family N-acetyltransferase n=1 Tax=Williamsia sp. MIQD14 TaxID=3425703 RepID=UPI003DA125EE